MHVLHRKVKDPLKFWLLLAVATLLVMVASAMALRTWYSVNWRPVSSSAATQYFTVMSGSSVHQIAVKLEDDKLIRNARAFEAYVRSNEYNNNLQAGTYSLSPSMSVQQIVKKMVSGDVAKNLLTILPGKRLDQIKAAFESAGYSPAEVEQAFNPLNYSSLPLMANLPQGATLEGYLYPDSFQKESQTPAQDIVLQSLQEMQKNLTIDVQKGFAAQSLSIDQGTTLASIVMQESDDPEYAPRIAQVLLSRLKQGMNLQSDVTAFYGSHLLGMQPSVNVDSIYNTYKHPGLPPGPIGNVDKIALNAVAHPADTDYLYFLAGDDGKVYFSHTQAEHDAAIKQYCQKKCAQ